MFIPTIAWAGLLGRVIRCLSVMGGLVSFGPPPAEGVADRIMADRSFMLSTSIPVVRDRVYDKVFFGVSPGEHHVRMQDLERIGPILGSEKTPYQIINLVPTIQDIPLVSTTTTTTHAHEPHDMDRITLFETVIIKDRGPFHSLSEYIAWKRAVLQCIVAQFESHPHYCLYIVPFWTLYDEWIPTMMNHDDKDHTIFIAPLSAVPAPFSHYKYMTTADLTPECL